MRVYMERNILDASGKYACDLCKLSTPDDPGIDCPPECDGWNKWEWRGPQEDKPDATKEASHANE